MQRETGEQEIVEQKEAEKTGDDTPKSKDPYVQSHLGQASKGHTHNRFIASNASDHFPGVVQCRLGWIWLRSSSKGNVG